MINAYVYPRGYTPTSQNGTNENPQFDQNDKWNQFKYTDHYSLAMQGIQSHCSLQHSSLGECNMIPQLFQILESLGTS